MMEELKTANEEPEEFAHVVSHDLKTPLNALSDNIKVLSLTAIRKSGLALQNLIDEILEYSRLTLYGIR